MMWVAVRNGSRNPSAMSRQHTSKPHGRLSWLSSEEPRPWLARTSTAAQALCPCLVSAEESSPRPDRLSSPQLRLVCPEPKRSRYSSFRRLLVPHSPLWTLTELSAQVDSALAVDYSGQANGRVREVPDMRTIRYYTTRGLLDPPAQMRGRTALYGKRHLLQLVAIKRLQAKGLRQVPRLHVWRRQLSVVQRNRRLNPAMPCWLSRRTMMLRHVRCVARHARKISNGSKGSALSTTCSRCSAAASKPKAKVQPSIGLPIVQARSRSCKPCKVPKWRMHQRSSPRFGPFRRNWKNCSRTSSRPGIAIPR